MRIAAFLGQRGHQNVCATWLAACCPVRSFYPHTHTSLQRRLLSPSLGISLKMYQAPRWEQHTCVCLISSALARWYNGIRFHLFQRKSQIRLHFEPCYYICCIRRNPTEKSGCNCSCSLSRRFRQRFARRTGSCNTRAQSPVRDTSRQGVQV